MLIQIRWCGIQGTSHCAHFSGHHVSLRRTRPVAQRHIRFATAYAQQPVVRQNMRTHVGVALGKGAQVGGQQFHRHRVGGGERDGPSQTGVCASSAPFQLLISLLHRQDVLDQMRASLGEYVATPAGLDQPRAQLLLQGRNAAEHCRFVDPELSGRKRQG